MRQGGLVTRTRRHWSRATAGIGLLAAIAASNACKAWIGWSEGIPLQESPPAHPAASTDASIFAEDATSADAADSGDESSSPPDAYVPVEDALSCAARGLGFDATTQTCVACRDLPSEPIEIFVSRIGQTVDPGAQGSRECPFASITKALAYATSRPSVRTIRIGPGSYTSANETFPLVVRGLELVGAGRDLTQIIGQGPYVGPTSLGGGLAGASMQVSLIVGHGVRETSISQLSIGGALPATPGTGIRSLGILCDQGGSRHNIETSTTLRNLLFPGNVMDEVFVTATTTPSLSSPCHLHVEDGEFHTTLGTGITISGESRPEWASRTLTVTLDIGDEEGRGGGRFLDTTSHEAINIASGSGRVTIRNSYFNGYRVFQSISTEGPLKGAFEVRSSRFENANGIMLDCRTRLDVLHDSVFLDGISGIASLFPSNENSCPAPVGGIVHARRNIFSRNIFPFVIQETPADFGTVDDPGGNDFGCNYMGGIQNGLTHPIVKAYGNAWDHPVNGVPNILFGAFKDVSKTTEDLRIEFEDPQLDFRGATLTNTACPDPPKL